MGDQSQPVRQGHAGDGQVPITEGRVLEGHPQPGEFPGGLPIEGEHQEGRKEGLHILGVFRRVSTVERALPQLSFTTPKLSLK